MTLTKTSVIACALSALVVGPVLAQGVSSDTKMRGSMQDKTMQGGASGSDLSAQPGAAGEKMGMKSNKGMKGTVGTTGSAAHKGTVDDAASDKATTGKRY
jgi:hypothetical protein